MSLSLLREVVDRLLDDIATQNGGDDVEVTEDFYWVLDPAQLFDPLHSPDPERMTLGQLSDDVAELSGIAARLDELHVWHDLAHVVGESSSGWRGGTAPDRCARRHSRGACSA